MNSIKSMISNSRMSKMVTINRETVTFLRGWAIIFIVLMHIVVDGKLTNLPTIFYVPINLLGGYGVYVFFFVLD